MASSVGQIKKLVGLLGGPRDTVDHRKRIADANAVPEPVQLSNRCRRICTNMKWFASTHVLPMRVPTLWLWLCAAIQDLAKRTKAAIMDLHTPGGAPGDGDAKARKLLQDFVAILQVRACGV
eukprot:365898-Chlamydomonas_euryale.AAC.12